MDMSNGAPNPVTEEEIASANRVRARNSIFLAGKVSVEGVNGEHDVRVRNLSATGAMLECKLPVHRGQGISLETKGIGKVNGKVAWAVDGRIGVAFDQMVNPEDTKSVARPEGIWNAGVPEYLKATLNAIPGNRKI
jgi:hypothetical protein